MALYIDYANVKPVGIMPLSNWGGLEVLALEEYRVLACFNFGTGRQHIRYHKIEYTASGREYFRVYGVRYYLDEIIRA